MSINNDLDHVNDNHYGQKLSNEFDHYMPDEFAKAIDCTAKAADESVLAEKEFAPEPSQEWINGLPPAGVECMYRDTHDMYDKATKKQIWSEWRKCRIEVESKDYFIVTVIDQDGCDDYEYPVIKGRSQFTPIKTAEQIAAKAKEAKRIELANSLKEVIEFRGSRVGAGVINSLVDYLDRNYGLLEAPKGDL